MPEAFPVKPILLLAVTSSDPACGRARMAGALAAPGEK
jgi:hypothetical protein